MSHPDVVRVLFCSDFIAACKVHSLCEIGRDSAARFFCPVAGDCAHVIDDSAVECDRGCLFTDDGLSCIRARTRQSETDSGGVLERQNGHIIGLPGFERLRSVTGKDDIVIYGAGHCHCFVL